MTSSPLSKKIVQQIQELPPHLLVELSAYIDFLASKRKAKKNQKFSLNWVGALEAEGKDYTSLELQKKALDWRTP